MKKPDFIPHFDLDSKNNLMLPYYQPKYYMKLIEFIASVDTVIYASMQLDYIKVVIVRGSELEKEEAGFYDNLLNYILQD
jgi:hypothetical protein